MRWDGEHNQNDDYPPKYYVGEDEVYDINENDMNDDENDMNDDEMDFNE